MLEAEFWSLISESKGSLDSCTQTEEHAAALKDRLIALGPELILEFKIVFESMLSLADSEELSAVQFLAHDYTSDDSFLAFSAWVIAQGAEVFHKAVEEPISLAETLLKMKELGQLDGAAQGGEYFLYAADTAYDELVGADIWEDLPEEIGKDSAVKDGRVFFTEEDICDKFPLLCQRFGYRFETA